jgi:hypothetical protein
MSPARRSEDLPEPLTPEISRNALPLPASCSSLSLQVAIARPRPRKIGVFKFEDVETAERRTWSSDGSGT